MKNKSLLFQNMFINIFIVLFTVSVIAVLSCTLSTSILTNEIEEQISVKLDQAVSTIEAAQQRQTDQLTILANSPSVMTQLSGTDDSNLTTELKSVSKLNTYLKNIILIGKTGTVIYDSSSSTNIGIDLSDRSYFQEAITGKTAQSSLITSKADGTLVQVEAVPIYKGSEVTGVLAAVVSADYISDLLKDVQVGNSGYAFLIDKDGTILYHPTADLLLKNASDLGVAELSKELPSMEAGKSGSIEYNYNGKTKLDLYRPLGQWSLSLNAVKSEYLQPVYLLIRNIIIAGLLVIILSTAGCALNSVLMIRKIRAIQGIIKAVTQGDLTVSIPEEDISAEEKGGNELRQIGGSINQLIHTMKEMITDINRLSQELFDSSQELYTGSEETSASAESITQTMESISEKTSVQADYSIQVDQMAADMHGQLLTATNRVREMTVSADQVNTTAVSGKEQIDVTIEGMEQIQEQTQKIDDVMTQLIQQSDEIGKINELITSISEQTNLLSLNASIEASRAGEHGRGFAVVAGEIGKLAGQSQTSAQAIAGLIQRIMEHIHEASSLMSKETELVDLGISSVVESKKAFIEITDQVDQLVGSMHLIEAVVNDTKQSSLSVTEAVKGMSSLCEASNSAITEITASAQEQTAVSEEISKSSMQLAMMAESLVAIVKHFRI